MTENVPQQPDPKSHTSVDDIKAKIANVSSEKRWAMSCYIPVIGLLTCVLASVKMVDSKFCRFHARQGLVLFALFVLAVLLGMFFPRLSIMLQGIMLALFVAGIIFSYRGREVAFPIVSQFAEKIPEYFVFKTLTGKIPEQDSLSNVPVEKKNQENVQK